MIPGVVLAPFQETLGDAVPGWTLGGVFAPRYATNLGLGDGLGRTGVSAPTRAPQAKSRVEWGTWGFGYPTGLGDLGREADRSVRPHTGLAPHGIGR